jgi:hypothetical protein
MRRAIMYMCGHCRHAIYFEEYVSLIDLSTLECSECGRGGPVLALDVERPPDTPILRQIPQQWLAPPRSAHGLA